MGERVMGNSGIDTEIFKPHITGVASSSAAYRLGMPQQEALTRMQWSNAGTFFTQCFRKIEDSLDLDEQQHAWWVISCILYIIIFVESKKIINK